MNDPDLVWLIETDPVLHLFLNGITDQAVFTIDPDGIITTWNEGCRRIKRYSYDETFGEHFRMLYIPEDREQRHPEGNLKIAFENGQFHEERLRMRKGGEPFMANVSIYRLDKDGQHAGFAKVVRDVSERHRLEEQRRAFEKRLERANEALHGFCHSVAHDLRSPIRALVSKCRTLQEEYAASLPPEARGDFQSVVGDGLRLGRIVDDLLAFAQLGEGEIAREAIDLTALVRRVADDVAPHCQAGTGRIEVQEGMLATADPTTLEFVLRNLIENACKYSHPDVRVWIGMREANGESVVSVRDDGIGFDVADLDRMLEPFKRLRPDEYQGTGLGLANVRRVVERHGGRVWAESKPGEGATFSFTLA